MSKQEHDILVDRLSNQVETALKILELMPIFSLTELGQRGTMVRDQMAAKPTLAEGTN